jgi:hypothetical protein
MKQGSNDMNRDKAGAVDGASADKAENDLVWGASAIGAEIDRTAAQVYSLFESGALDGAVSKLGHKTFVGSRRALRALPFKKSNERRRLETAKRKSMCESEEKTSAGSS